MIGISDVLVGMNTITGHLPFFLAPTAYIDPNTGGMLFQLLAVLFGVISGVFLFFSGRIKNYYYKLRRRMGGAAPAAAEEEKLEEPQQKKE